MSKLSRVGQVGCDPVNRPMHERDTVEACMHGSSRRDGDHEQVSRVPPQVPVPSPFDLLTIGLVVDLRVRFVETNNLKESIELVFKSKVVDWSAC